MTHDDFGQMLLDNANAKMPNGYEIKLTESYIWDGKYHRYSFVLSHGDGRWVKGYEFDINGINEVVADVYSIKIANSFNNAINNGVIR